MLFIVVALSLGIACLFSIYSYKQLLSHQNTQLQQQNILLQNNLKIAKQKNRKTELKLAKQIITQAYSKKKNKLTDLESFLKKNWTSIQNQWQKTAIGIYNHKGYKVGYVGEEHGYSGRNAVLSFVDLTNIDKNNSSYNHAVCYDSCRYLTAIATQFGRNTFFLVLETDITNILSFMPKTENIDYVILGKEQQIDDNESTIWNRKFFGFNKNNLVQFIGLKQLAANFDWNKINNLNDSESLNTIPSWYIKTFPLSAEINAPVFISITNLESFQQTLNEFKYGIIWLLLVTVILTCLFVLFFSFNFIQRLKKQTYNINKLINKNFDAVHQNLPSRTEKSNELDMLEQGIFSLGEELEKAQHKIDVRIYELERQSMLDTLTGLPNTAVMKHELKKEIACLGRVHSQLALFFLDLDEFRRINDTWGHVYGDELLKIVAQRLTNTIRSVDTLFKYNGDEFLILLRGISDEDIVRYIVHKIFKAFQEPVVIENRKLIVTSSIGIALCNSSNLTADDLIKHAELAMYHAKKSGRNNYSLFNYDMLAQANNKMMIEQDISAAISGEQLSLFLQPIIELSTGKIRGFEALIRWHHPELGLIMPANFIPEIEDSDATIEVGNFVIKTGIALIKQLQEIGWNELYLSVNISAKHWLSPGLKEYIDITLKQHEVSPRSLVLELTEESVIAIDQIDQARGVFQSLKHLGIKIAIDDFGTGYSSINYLKNLPFDIVKIDRSFTKGVKENSIDPHIVNTMVELAHNLELKVIAEGVETEEQAEFMKNAGCELCQGYLFSKPIDKKQAFETISIIKQEKIWPKS